MVNLKKLVTSRPIMVFCVLAALVVTFGSISISIWHTAIEKVTDEVAIFTQHLRSSLVSEVENIGKFTYLNTNLSTIGLARVIDSYQLNKDTNFTDIQIQIAPMLFQAYSTIPQVSQVSYISENGLLFAYISESNTRVAVFANTLLDSSGGNYTWYTQTVDQITGQLNGNANKSQPSDVIHTDWFKDAQRISTTAFVGRGLAGEKNETMFQSVASLHNKKGVVSLGFPVKTLTDVLDSLNLRGEELYMWTKEDETVIFSEGSLNTSFFITNDSVCFGNKDSKPVRSQCIPKTCSSKGFEVEIKDSKFQAFCSDLEVSGVTLRYTLMFPNDGGVSLIKHNAHVAIYLLIGFTVFFAFGWHAGFLWFMMQATRTEMRIRSKLITQNEALNQAERKSLNKSKAFAGASHDIRGTLAGITGLIDLCRAEVPRGSEVDNTLKQISACSKDLVGLLNSVLDMSKIESGKMLLDEDEFNLGKLLEDVIDFYHPTAMKKGVDVVLDLPDVLIFKFSKVVGDSGKLKQILNNLVSNAVKFTVDGHISIRAWSRKPGSKNSTTILPSNPQGSVSNFVTSVLSKNKDQSASNKTETTSSIRTNANTMEFVFEVDDTGKGIPYEMRQSVFENFVQVRETAKGQLGTGLGLGIVQSLVRLMGGEIRITDKAMGERGTCFQFSILLATLESSPVADKKVRQDIESGGDYISTPNLGLTIKTLLGGNLNKRSLSPRFNACLSSSPKQESSRVVLLLKNKERRRVTEKYIKNLGLKVTVVEKWEQLSNALERVFGFSPQSSMGQGESTFSFPSSRDIPLIGMDGIDSRSNTPRRRSNRFSAFVLLVIDVQAGPFAELYDTVERFHKGLDHEITCKVVWLNGIRTHGTERGDISCSRPLHGSRLNQVLKMLPEFGGAERNEIQEEGPSLSLNKNKGKAIMSPTFSESEIWAKSVRTTGQKLVIGNVEDKQGTPKPSEDECFLRGKSVMVVDDLRITSSLATRKLKKMGASDVIQCNSGIEAVKFVTDWLIQREQGVINLLPIDYIFMDCQMPEMDGYEATTEIRKMEKKYGLHIPIIAVSGHDPGSREAAKTIEAGMDAFLEKNMDQNRLANIIKDIDRKMTLHATLI